MIIKNNIPFTKGNLIQFLIYGFLIKMGVYTPDTAYALFIIFTVL